MSIVATEMCPECGTAVVGFKTFYEGATYFSDYGISTHQSNLKTLYHELQPCGHEVDRYEAKTSQGLVVYSWLRSEDD